MKIESDIDTTVEVAVIPIITTSTAPVTIPNPNPISKNDDISLNETLDWSQKVELSTRLKEFKENVLWKHIMTQEYECVGFLQYLFYITYISYKDYQYSIPK